MGEIYRASSARHYVEDKSDIIPAGVRPQILDMTDKIDDHMRLFIFGQFYNLYDAITKNIPDAPDVFSFSDPLDEFSEPNKKPINEAIAEIILRSGMYHNGRRISYDEKNRYFKIKTKKLASELLELFMPDFGLFTAYARFDGTRERVATYVGLGMPLHFDDSLQTAMVRTLGEEQPRDLPESPLSSQQAWRDYEDKQKQERDQEIAKKIVLPLLKEAVDGTVELFEDLGRHLMAGMDSKARRNGRKVLALRAAEKVKNPNSEPFFSDRTAQILQEELDKPRRRVKNRPTARAAKKNLGPN